MSAPVRAGLPSSLRTLTAGAAEQPTPYQPVQGSSPVHEARPEPLPEALNASSAASSGAGGGRFVQLLAHELLLV